MLEKESAVKKDHIFSEVKIQTSGASTYWSGVRWNFIEDLLEKSLAEKSAWDIVFASCVKKGDCWNSNAEKRVLEKALPEWAML